MLQELLTKPIYASVFIFILSFLIVYFIVPNISSVVVSRKLNDIPDQRSSHQTPTPTLAGFSFFFALILVIFFIQKFDVDQIAINIIELK